jgi:hypothetical protein
MLLQALWAADAQYKKETLCTAARVSTHWCYTAVHMCCCECCAAAAERLTSPQERPYNSMLLVLVRATVAILLHWRQVVPLQLMSLHSAATWRALATAAVPGAR